jgi:hypothetical protein
MIKPPDLARHNAGIVLVVVHSFDLYAAITRRS